MADQQQWDLLVERYCQQVWDTARRHNLDATVAAEVCQLTWLRLADHLPDVGNDNEIGAWLCAVADDEARKVAVNGSMVWTVLTVAAAALALAAVGALVAILT